MEDNELDYETGILDCDNIQRRRWENSRYRGLEGGLRKPGVNSVHQGTVRRIQPFGAFISIEGMDRDGLLHISCLSTCRVEKVEDVLTVGDKVWVKVMAVEEDGKYKLDMRGINQKDGTDTDPNNLERSSRPKSTSFFRADPIKLDAVLNITCTRCKGTGHMRHECYNTTGETYEMLDEEPANSGAPANAVASATATTSPFATGANAVQLQKALPVSLQREVEKKEEKKHRRDPTKKGDGGRQKRHQRYSSSSSDADTSSSSGSRRKKHRKKKRKRTKDSKKKKRRS